MKLFGTHQTEDETHVQYAPTKKSTNKIGMNENCHSAGHLTKC